MGKVKVAYYTKVRIGERVVPHAIGIWTGQESVTNRPNKINYSREGSVTQETRIKRQVTYLGREYERK